MKISIIGAGNIGKTLGNKWAQAGHQVTYGVRNPADPKYAGLTVVPVVESLADAEIILLSLPGAGVAEFAAQFGANLAGKIVIDATNNPRSPQMNNLDALQAAAPDAVLVRAFSTLGWENFADPQLGGQQIDLFYAAAESARPAAEQLIREIGLRPVCLGGLESVPAVDGLTRAWFALAFGQAKGRRVAFKLLEEYSSGEALLLGLQHHHNHPGAVHLRHTGINFDRRNLHLNKNGIFGDKSGAAPLSFDGQHFCFWSGRRWAVLLP